MHICTRIAIPGLAGPSVYLPSSKLSWLDLIAYQLSNADREKYKGENSEEKTDVASPLLGVEGGPNLSQHPVLT